MAVVQGGCAHHSSVVLTGMTLSAACCSAATVNLHGVAILAKSSCARWSNPICCCARSCLCFMGRLSSPYRGCFRWVGPMCCLAVSCVAVAVLATLWLCSPCRFNGCNLLCMLVSSQCWLLMFRCRLYCCWPGVLLPRGGFTHRHNCIAGMCRLSAVAVLVS